MSKISADNLSDKNDTVSVPVPTVVAGSAKAWVNFNGTGTVAIRDSFNVTSITDNGVGDYTVNFTNAMANANYIYGGQTGDAITALHYGGSKTTSSLRVQAKDTEGTGALRDKAEMNIVIFAN